MTFETIPKACVDWIDVETCLALATLYDTEDLTHPPHAPADAGENNENNEEEDD